MYVFMRGGGVNGIELRYVDIHKMDRHEQTDGHTQSYIYDLEHGKHVNKEAGKDKKKKIAIKNQEVVMFTHKYSSE